MIRLELYLCHARDSPQSLQTEGPRLKAEVALKMFAEGFGGVLASTSRPVLVLQVVFWGERDLFGHEATFVARDS